MWRLPSAAIVSNRCWSVMTKRTFGPCFISWLPRGHSTTVRLAGSQSVRPSGSASCQRARHYGGSEPIASAEAPVSVTDALEGAPCHTGVLAASRRPFLLLPYARAANNGTALKMTLGRRWDFRDAVRLVRGATASRPVVLGHVPCVSRPCLHQPCPAGGLSSGVGDSGLASISDVIQYGITLRDVDSSRTRARALAASPPPSKPCRTPFPCAGRTPR